MSTLDYKNKKSFKDLYYIENTAWKSKLDLQKIKKFNNMKYENKIILHFDFLFSITKVVSDKKADKTLFISAINICLRLYEIIKKLYPYNNIYVIIYTKNKTFFNLNIEYSTFRSIIDIIPNFAIVADNQELEISFFDEENYKHIIYGHIPYNFMNSDYQFWNILHGNLFVKNKKENNK